MKVILKELGYIPRVYWSKSMIDYEKKVKEIPLKDYNKTELFSERASWSNSDISLIPSNITAFIELGMETKEVEVSFYFTLADKPPTY